ncbi:MAG: DNA-binding protein AraC-type [Clostridiales bacterium]|jgi:AraC family transcriptional regulator|nr:DNA-binding protein AraC-type [Clostridiales bacterium]
MKENKGVRMDYFLTVSSIIIYLENRIQEKIEYEELERATGFSIAHIRDVFVTKTGMTLSRYILVRKISNAAYEILYNSQSIMNIATKYGFTNYDTFTRAFKRITGLTPSEFRKKRPPVGKIKLCACAFGIGLLNPINREDGNNV